MKKKKTVYYNDPLNDDFAGTKITRKDLPKNFLFYHSNPIWKFFSFILYYIVAVPVIFLFLKIAYHVKVVGKKNIRHLKGGYFVYGNHTQIIDAFTGQLFASRRRKGYIVADPDATSIPGIRGLLCMLGVIPIPTSSEEHVRFKEAIGKHIRKGHVVTIYPEAHIWPYCTHIRPFTEASFVYPCELNVPVVGMVMTYRQRRFFKNARPYPTIHLSRPFYPNDSLSLPDRKLALRNHVYEYFLDIASDEDNVEYIAYRKAK